MSPFPPLSPYLPSCYAHPPWPRLLGCFLNNLEASLALRAFLLPLLVDITELARSAFLCGKSRAAGYEKRKKLIVGSVVWEFMVLKKRTFIPPKNGPGFLCLRPRNEKDGLFSSFAHGLKKH